MSDYAHVVKQENQIIAGYPNLVGGGTGAGLPNTPLPPVFKSGVLETEIASSVIFKIKLGTADVLRWNVSGDVSSAGTQGNGSLTITHGPMASTVINDGGDIQISVWTLMGGTWLKTMAKADCVSSGEYLLSTKTSSNHFGTYSDFLKVSSNYSIIGSQMYLQIEPTVSETNTVLNTDDVWDWMAGNPLTADAQNGNAYGYVNVDSLDIWMEYKKEF